VVREAEFLTVSGRLFQVSAETKMKECGLKVVFVLLLLLQHSS